ncbi:glycosyltransferase family 4 protein [Salinimonas lutimaris]|uniref:glycosyltransferase family 4 protein n=1 Tax=Salinimonas lutimaris TaxID=914153 RepID=UPI0010BF70DD|nr:glycosyltransferase family 4 protein [Salinimonas lutimaris]
MHNQRILIMSHGHPEINKGGAEVAAYNMYKELERAGQDVYFVARTAQTPHGGAAFSTRNTSREILFHTTMDDGFLFSNLKTRHIWQEFRDLLQLIKPDVVHLHHYFLFGIEVLQEIKHTLPEAKVVLTLHEFLAICHNKGLMVKTDGKLCYKASPRDCHGCFPEKQPGDFFFREKYLKALFQNVDHFVSPSHFLKQRYVDWGLQDHQISVIENGQPITPCAQKSEQSSGRVHLAFFGQINPYKGIDVLLKALSILPDSVAKKVSVDIYGANLDKQDSSYQKQVKKLLKKVRHLVSFHGAYESHEMPDLLAGADWAIVPSVWWENSPMVIQEAFSAGVPLIVSNIGGMKEKVQHQVNGLHFRAGSATDLADTIEQCLEPDVIQQCSGNIIPTVSISECVTQHLALYSQ